MRYLHSLAIVAVLMLGGTLGALAHAKMAASNPKDGATVAAGVSEIKMTFSHPMRLTRVRVHGADGADMPLKGALPKGFDKAAKVGVAPLGAGAYEVSWSAVSEDGHVMKGHFAFTVAKAP